MDVSTLFPYGWPHYLLGGLAIGAGVALLFVFTGLVGGMSSVFSSTWSIDAFQSIEDTVSGKNQMILDLFFNAHAAILFDGGNYCRVCMTGI